MKTLQQKILVLFIICLVPVIPSVYAEDTRIDFSRACLFGREGYTEDNAIVLPKNNSAMFSVNVSSHSLYRLYINGEFAAHSIYNISIDKKIAENVSIGQYDYSSVSVYIHLQPLQKNITIFVAAGSAKIKSLELIPISEDAVENFINEINHAESSQTVKNTIASYSQSLQMDIEALERSIFYPVPAYDKLLHKKYKNINRIVEDLYAALYEEIENPRVNLSENGIKLCSLQQGEMNIEVLRNCSAYVTILAVYDEQGKLYYVSSFIEDGTAAFSDTVSLSNQKKAGNFTFKLLSWDIQNAMQPKEKFNGIEKELYISPNGDDRADGNKETPFLTLSRAREEIKKHNANMQGDIVVHLASGEYNIDEAEIITQACSGRNGYRVYFKGDENTGTILSGGKRITGWQPWKNGIYKAKLDSVNELRELYVNGLPAIRARSKLLYTYKEDSAESNENIKKIVVSDEEFPVLAHPDEAELVWEMAWVCQRTPVLNVEKSDGKTVVTLANFYQPDRIDAVMVQPNKTFYIENGLELLDEPGEFYYSNTEKTVYYYPEPGENIYALNVVAPISEGLLSVVGESLSNKVSHIAFENITFRYGTWNQPNDYPLLSVQAGSATDAETQEQQIMPPAQICVNYADHIDFTSCRFESLGTNALALDNGVTNSSFVGNIIQNIGGAAISIGNLKQSDSLAHNDGVVCKNIYIANNVIRRTAVEYRGMPSVVAYYGNGIKIVNNDMKDTAYSGISIGWGWNSTSSVSRNNGRFLIGGNRIARVMQSVVDGANVYTLGALPDSVIRDNYFDQNMAPVQLQYPGIYLDEGSQYVSVCNNVVTNCGNRWLFINSTLDHLNAEISNNYTDGTTYTNKSGTALGDNIMGMTEPTAEAQGIIALSGVETAFNRLLSDVEVSDEKATSLYASPEYTYHEGTFIKAIEFTDGRVKECGENYVSFNSGNWLEYAVEMPKDGVYSVEAYVAIGGENTSNQTELAWQIRSEGVTRSSKAAYTGGYGTYKPVMLGEAVFKAGINTLWIKNISSVSCHLSHLIVYDGMCIEAVKYAEGQVKEHGENYVSFNTGNWLEYNINLPQGGTYSVTVYAAIGGDDPLKQIELAWQARPESVMRFSNVAYTGGYGIYRPFTLGEATFNAGNNTLWIKNIAASGCHIRKILIQKK